MDLSLLDNEKGKIDLHLHTNYSDGIYSPSEIVNKSYDTGLRYIAITDHETTLGLDEAKEEGRRLGIEVLCGVEISAGYENRELHVLGYMKSVTPELSEKLAILRDGRFERMEKMINNLRNMNISVAFEEMEKETGKAAPGRLHLARLMVKKGYVSSIKEAFEQFIGRGKPAYIPRIKLDIQDALKLLNDNNAISFLAHPGITNEGIDSIRILKEKGLKGIEVFHPEHTQGMTSLYKSIAETEGLLVSGGSDYHGEGKSSCKNPGCVYVSYNHLKKIKHSLNQPALAEEQKA